MKYFTKFLPVEGQINENDIVMSTNGVCCIYGKTSRHGLSTIQSTFFKFLKDPRKAELYLCTYDIVQGDRVHNDNHNHTTLVADLEGFLRTEPKNSKSYRTIGIISSSAIFVHENQQLEEDYILQTYTAKVEKSYRNGVKTHTLLFDHKPKSWEIQEKAEMWAEYEMSGQNYGYDLKFDEEDEVLPGIIKIRCSQCNTFH